MCSKNNSLKVFTFGVGNGCDQNLVKLTAAAGRGEAYFAADGEPKELKTKVIKALS